VNREREPHEIQKKNCPRCQQETYAVLMTCPVCGFKWPDLDGIEQKPAREPARRMLLGLLIALLGLLGSFCLLYVLVLSFSKRGL
jgi:hypothetical protein